MIPTVSIATLGGKTRHHSPPRPSHPPPSISQSYPAVVPKLNPQRYMPAHSHHHRTLPQTLSTIKRTVPKADVTWPSAFAVKRPHSHWLYPCTCESASSMRRGPCISSMPGLKRSAEPLCQACKAALLDRAITSPLPPAWFRFQPQSALSCAFASVKLLGAH